MPHEPVSLPDFARWPSFPFKGDLRLKQLAEPVDVEPPRKGEGSAECVACNAPDEAYIWVSERWRVRAMDRPSGLPVVLILESRSHLDLGDLPNMLAAELGVMTVRLERAIRSLDGVARVHVNRWGDGWAHLHIWFLARPYGRLQLRGTFLPVWDAILPPIPEARWRENLALVAAWLAEFGGRALAEPPRIEWRAPSQLSEQVAEISDLLESADADEHRDAAEPGGPVGRTREEGLGSATGGSAATDAADVSPAQPVTTASPSPAAVTGAPTASAGPTASDTDESSAANGSAEGGVAEAAAELPADGRSGVVWKIAPSQRVPMDRVDVDVDAKPEPAGG